MIWKPALPSTRKPPGGRRWGRGGSRLYRGAFAGGDVGEEGDFFSDAAVDEADGWVFLISAQ